MKTLFLCACFVFRKKIGLNIVSKVSIYGNIHLSMYRNIGRVLPSTVWHPRVFQADAQRKLVYRYQTSLRRGVRNVQLEEGHYVTLVFQKKALTRAAGKIRSNPTAHEERYPYTYVYIPGNIYVQKRVTQEQMRTTVLLVNVLWFIYICTQRGECAIVPTLF